MRYKRFTALFLAFLLLLTLGAAACAADTSQSFSIVLTTDKSGELSPGDEITVTCTLRRTDESESWQMYAWQTEIAYDNSAFELVEGSIAPAYGVGSSHHTGDTENRVYFNDYAMSADGNTYPAELMAGSFKLKVAGEAVSGQYAVKNTNFLVSTKGGADEYAAQSHDLSLAVKGKAPAPSGGSSGGTGGGAVVIAPPNVKTSFSDVPAGAWYEDAVKFVVQRGLFNGVSETEFAPAANMTRAMLMTVLARLDGTDTSGGETWYEKGMAWAVEKGISDGTSPEKDITREQLVTMLYRYLKYKGLADGSADLSAYSDSGDVSSWAREAMSWAVSAGIITGRTESALVPLGTANRAEVATIFMRFCENIITGG